MESRQLMYHPVRQKEGWTATLAIYFLVLGIATYALAMFLVVPRSSDIDELGLFNPVYMKLHFGRMTYPIYGHFHAMFVHPPVRYSEIAAFMRLGLTFPYAEGLMVAFLTIAIGLAIAWAGFDYLSKLGLLFGFSSAVIWMAQVYDRSYSLRPDTQLALAWFLGLVLLQDGKLHNWESRRIFLGSFALTYASGIHYYGVLAFLGIAYYLLRANQQLPRDAFPKVAAASVGGACLFGVPYLLLFVLPNFWDIYHFSREVQSAGQWFSPIVKHFAQYSFWKATSRPTSSTLPFYDLLYPILGWKIPLFVLGSIVLMLKRNTHELGVANLPLTVFVFAYSQGKSAGYLLPELIVYFCGVGILFCWLLQTLFRAIAPKVCALATALVFAAGCCWSTQFGYPAYALAFPALPLVPAMDLARACAQEIVGRSALIGGRLGLWYVSGAHGWYGVEPDLLWKKDISHVNLREYFSRFDYVVEHDHMSNTTINASLESLPSWYVSGVLKLQGFFSTDVNVNLNFLVFKTAASSQIKGFIASKRRVFRFDQNDGGTFVFISRVCQFDSWPPSNKFHLPNFNAIYLPKANSQDPSRSILPVARPGQLQSAVVTSTLTREEFDSRRQALDTECSVLDTVPGTLQEIDLDTLMKRWRNSETPMRFYKSIGEVTASRFSPSTTTTLPPLDLNQMRLLYGRAKLSGDQTKTVVTAFQSYSFAAGMEMPKTDFPAHGWLAIRQKVTNGQVGFGILDEEKNDFVVRQFLNKEDGFETVYLALDRSSAPKMLVVENGDHGGSSEVQIQDMRFILETGSKITRSKTTGTPE